MLKWHWFQWILNAVFLFFTGIMVYVMYTAISRSPGSTGQDIGEMQEKRLEYSKEQRLVLE